jgi:hypothetical protein
VQIFSSAPCSQTPSVCVPPLISETRFTLIANYRKNCSLAYFNFYVFRQETRRQKILYWMVGRFTRVGTSPHYLMDKLWFVTVVLKYFNFAASSKDLLANFVLRYLSSFWWREMNIYLVFSAFTSRPTPYQCQLEVLWFSLWNLCYIQINLYHEYISEDLVSYLISVTPGFPGPSWWRILKQSWKRMAIMHLLVLDHTVISTKTHKNRGCLTEGCLSLTFTRPPTFLFWSAIRFLSVALEPKPTEHLNCVSKCLAFIFRGYFERRSVF